MRFWVKNVSHCGLMVNTGSRDEHENESGMAHFIEHMIFKGTKKRKAYHVLSRIENIGGDLNACDAARILRIPGTLNHKYDNKPECRVIHDTDFTYSLDDFLDVLPEAQTEHRGDDQKEGNKSA